MPYPGQQALLADDLIEATRAHALGQRFEFIGVSREQFGGLMRIASIHPRMIGHSALGHATHRHRCAAHGLQH